MPPWNHLKTIDFLMTLGGIEVNWFGRIRKIFLKKFGDDPLKQKLLFIVSYSNQLTWAYSCPDCCVHELIKKTAKGQPISQCWEETKGDWLDTQLRAPHVKWTKSLKFWTLKNLFFKRKIKLKSKYKSYDISKVVWLIFRL